MKHISKMTQTEMEEMTAQCEAVVARYAHTNNFSGLSHNGWFNFYRAIQDAIRGEWQKTQVRPENCPPKGFA